VRKAAQSVEFKRWAYLLSEGLSDVRIIEGGYSALTDALKPGKVLKIIQSNNGDNS